MTRFSRTLAGLALIACASIAHAHGYQVGDVVVAHPYAVATPPGATTGAAYLKAMTNLGAVDDRLVAASSSAADHVEMHTMTMDGDVMRMRPVTRIVIPAKGRVEMAPGSGYHLMLVGIRQPLTAGDRIPLRLRFEKAGTVDVELQVQERGAAAGTHVH